MPPFAVGAWWRPSGRARGTAKITAVVGDGASYDVEYTGLAQLNARMPAARCAARRAPGGAGGAGAGDGGTRARKSYLDTTPAAARCRGGSRKARERHVVAAAGRPGPPRRRSALGRLAHPSVGGATGEDRATVSALQDAYATAREARRATLELSQRMERREKAWDEREAHWGQTLEEERALRALGEELAAERSGTPRRAEGHEVAHDMNTARQHRAAAGRVRGPQGDRDGGHQAAAGQRRRWPHGEEVQALAAELDTVRSSLWRRRPRRRSRRSLSTGCKRRATTSARPSAR